MQGAKERWWSVPPAPVGPQTLTTRRAYLEVLGVFGVFFASGIAAAAFSVAGHNPSGTVEGWADAIPGSIDQIAVTVLCVLVPVLLARQRGLTRRDLGLSKPAVTRSQWIRIAAWAVLALIAGSVVTGLLATGNYPEVRSYPDLTYNLFHAAQAGFIEEVVVLAFVVVTLEQARRPRAEIIAVALVLRASYHIYYGPGVLGIFIWAAVFLWLFLRFRTIVPLIIVHSSWDLLAFLAYQWRAVGAVETLAFIALFITAFVTWLVDRGKRAPAGPGPMLGPPGWYLDPSGTGGLRWYSGWEWTPFAYPPGPAPPYPPQPPVLGVEGRPAERW